MDLGLPSGTLWCKWNIGATNENTPESWYGDYYAWGETEIKSKYTSKSYTYKENPEILPNDNDIAYLTNNLMHIPDKDQIQELISLPNKWVTNYNNVSGLNGKVFTGTNSNELFIPAAGIRHGSNIYYTGNYCYLWSRSLYTDDPGFARNLDCYSSSTNINLDNRYYGLSVRGVIDNNI